MKDREQQIHEAIGSWANIPTWHTSHPLDMKRFHDAIRNLYKTVPDVMGGEIVVVLEEYVRVNPPTLDGGATAKEVEDYAHRAAVILDYLRDEEA